jgi:hypothetical protein
MLERILEKFRALEWVFYLLGVLGVFIALYVFAYQCIDMPRPLF